MRSACRADPGLTGAPRGGRRGRAGRRSPRRTSSMRSTGEAAASAGSRRARAPSTWRPPPCSRSARGLGVAVACLLVVSDVFGGRRARRGSSEEDRSRRPWSGWGGGRGGPRRASAAVAPRGRRGPREGGSDPRSASLRLLSRSATALESLSSSSSTASRRSERARIRLPRRSTSSAAGTFSERIALALAWVARSRASTATWSAWWSSGFSSRICAISLSASSPRPEIRSLKPSSVLPCFSALSHDATSVDARARGPAEGAGR